jgi:mannose/fructose/N-acetylgalactosamine-specific phosphotransferase system component IIC
MTLEAGAKGRNVRFYSGAKTVISPTVSSGILQLTFMGLKEPGGRIACAPDLVTVTRLELLLGVEEHGERRDPALDLELRQVIAMITRTRRAVAPVLVLATQHELRQGIATIPLGSSGILQLALMGLGEPGGRRAAAPEFVCVTPLALMELEEPGGRRAHAPDYVPVSCLELLLGVEEPGGSRAAAPDLELQQVVAMITGGRKDVAPVLVLVTHHELWQGIATIPLGPSGILQLAFMGLEEPGGRIACAPDLVKVTWLELRLDVEEPGGRRDPAPDLELRPVIAMITRTRRAVAPVLVLVTQHELWQGIATIPLGPSGILQLACMGLEETGPCAPDLVTVTCLEQLLGVEEPGGRRDPAADLVLVAQLELLQVIERRSRAPDYVLVSCLELLLGVEDPGGRRAAAPDLELRQVVATITGGRRDVAPVLVLVTHHELWQGIATIPLGPLASCSWPSWGWKNLEEE